MVVGADLRLDCTATSSFPTLPLTMAWACNPHNQLLRISLRCHHIETHCEDSNLIANSRNELLPL